MILCTAFWSVKTCVLHSWAPYLFFVCFFVVCFFYFPFLMPILGDAPYTQKHLVIWKLRQFAENQRLKVTKVKLRVLPFSTWQPVSTMLTTRLARVAKVTISRPFSALQEKNQHVCLLSNSESKQVSTFVTCLLIDQPYWSLPMKISACVLPL